MGLRSRCVTSLHWSHPPVQNSIILSFSCPTFRTSPSRDLGGTLSMGRARRTTQGYRRTRPRRHRPGPASRLALHCKTATTRSLRWRSQRTTRQRGAGSDWQEGVQGADRPDTDGYEECFSRQATESSTKRAETTARPPRTTSALSHFASTVALFLPVASSPPTDALSNLPRSRRLRPFRHRQLPLRPPLGPPAHGSAQARAERRQDAHVVDNHDEG